ncbi:MAG: metallophosphoesterase [Fimbriimonadales bacterium]
MGKFVVKAEAQKDPPRTISRRTLITRGLVAAAGLSVLDAILVEPRWLALETVEVPIEDLPAPFDGYRIAQLSDFHYPNCISEGFICKAFALTAEFNPDIIALTGDFVHSYDRAERDSLPTPSLTGVLAGASAPDGVIGVLGNHDHWFGASGVRAELLKTAVKLLENENLVVRRGSDSIAFSGLGDFWEGEIDLDRTLGALPPHMPRIVLQHNPDLAEVFPAGYRVDLQLSGHTHGGQIRVPFGPAPLVPSKYGNKYRQGLVQGPRHPVYISRGIGVSSPIPLRFWCRPEVSGIILRAA